jgi:hypothetical protein
MHYIHDLWAWLLADNATRATVILVLITALYVILTWHMTRAIARQTRAMIQPVALLTFHWKEEKWYPEGYFEIKNLGSQPFLLLDVKLLCILQGSRFTEHYTLWDEHIIPPGESLSPQFDFKRPLEQAKPRWNAGWLSYSLEVVASDLSKQIVLTYRNIPVLSVVNVQRGMPISVRWRYFLKPFAWRYHRIFHRFKRPKIEL